MKEKQRREARPPGAHQGVDVGAFDGDGLVSETGEQGGGGRHGPLS
jgi:hypothetical protein